MAKSLKSFWSACEKLAAGGVMIEWEREVRDADVLAAARRLIAPSEQEALQYPCTNEYRCACSHEVIAHRDGTKVAICTCEDDECNAIPVSEEDLTVYVMDYAKILGGIGRAAGLQVVEPLLVDIHRPCHFADLDIGGKLIPAYFAMTGCGCLSSESLINLLVGSYDPFILFTPSPLTFHINSTNPRYSDSRLMICLADLFSTEDGKIRIDKRFARLVQDFAGKAAGEIRAHAVRDAHSESVFEASNDYHTISLRGQALPHLTNLQSDVAGILHKAQMSGKPEMSYAAIACRLAEIHARDTGFEPPDKMSKIFRAGDERSKLIKSTKRGYFRLNI